MTKFGVKWPENGWYALKPTNQPTSIFEKLYHHVWNEKSIKQETKITVFKTFILNTFLNESDNRFNQLDIFHNSCHRSIYGYIQRERISNTDCYKQNWRHPNFHHASTTEIGWICHLKERLQNSKDPHLMTRFMSEREMLDEHISGTRTSWKQCYIGWYIRICCFNSHYFNGKMLENQQELWEKSSSSLRVRRQKIDWLWQLLHLKTLLHVSPEYLHRGLWMVRNVIWDTGIRAYLSCLDLIRWNCRESPLYIYSKK